MNQNVTSFAYLAVGIISLIFVSHLLLQIMTLIFAFYCIFMGLSMWKTPPTMIIVMRSMFGRFFNRF